MWYEIIPSYAIISMALAVPGYAMYFMNKGVNGNVRQIIFLCITFLNIFIKSLN